MDELLSSLLSLCMNYCPPCLLYGLKCLDDYEFVYDFMSLYALWLFVDAFLLSFFFLFPVDHSTHFPSSGKLFVFLKMRGKVFG